MDKIVKIFFGFLLFFSLLILSLWLSDVPENATGFTDSTLTTLQKSGSTVATKPSLKWMSYLFGVGIITIFGFMVFIGGRKKETVIRKKVYRMLTIGMLLYLGIFTMMMNAWWSYTETNSMDYFLGLPKPTAWMIFGLMFIPAFISFFYITKFDEWVFSPEDQQRFDEIMAARRKREGG